MPDIFGRDRAVPQRHEVWRQRVQCVAGADRAERDLEVGEHREQRLLIRADQRRDRALCHAVQPTTVLGDQRFDAGVIRGPVPVVPVVDAVPGPEEDRDCPTRREINRALSLASPTSAMAAL